MSFSNNHVNADKSRSASRFAREYTEQYSCFVASIANKTLRKILSDFLVKELILFNVLSNLHFCLVAWFKVLGRCVAKVYLEKLHGSLKNFHE